MSSSSSQEIQANQKQQLDSSLPGPGLVWVASPSALEPIADWPLPLGDGDDVAPGFIDFGGSTEALQARLAGLTRFPVAKDEESLYTAVEGIVLSRCSGCACAFSELEDLTAKPRRSSFKKQKTCTERSLVPYVPKPLLECLEGIHARALLHKTTEVFWHGTDCVAGFYERSKFYPTFRDSAAVFNLSQCMAMEVRLSGGVVAEINTMLNANPEDRLPQSLVERVYRSLGEEEEEKRRDAGMRYDKRVVLYMPWIQIGFMKEDD